MTNVNKSGKVSTNRESVLRVAGEQVEVGEVVRGAVGRAAAVDATDERVVRRLVLWWRIKVKLHCLQGR